MMNRIPTTHVGSLPRPERLLAVMQAAASGKAIDEARLRNETRKAVAEVVAKQAALGIDFVSDGEMSKPDYATYVTERLSGFDGTWQGHVAQDLAEFPAFSRHLVRTGAVVPRAGGACCRGEVSMRGMDALHQDLAAFGAAIGQHPPTGTFLNAASPGVITVFQKNEYYPTDDAYIEAVAAAMRPEYETIVAAGHQLQIDCPDLAMGRHLAFADLTDEEFLVIVRRHVDALNEATEPLGS